MERSLGGILYWRRKELGLTRREVCDGICYTNGLLAYEHGLTVPRVAKLMALGKRLDLHEKQLLQAWNRQTELHSALTRARQQLRYRELVTILEQAIALESVPATIERLERDLRFYRGQC